MKRFEEHIKTALIHLTGLLRTRVIISMVGMMAMCKHPEIAQWIVSICGLALGVSAIDAFRETRGMRDDK